MAVYDSGNPEEKAYTEMTIFVNRNENAPTFTRELYQRTVLENSGLGSSLLMVEATDDDQVQTYINISVVKWRQ